MLILIVALVVNSNGACSFTLLTFQILAHVYVDVVYFCYSILFADLVNFTQLTTKCSAKDLVEMLNEIYGKFDSLARVRIKLSMIIISGTEANTGL